MFVPDPVPHEYSRPNIAYDFFNRLYLPSWRAARTSYDDTHTILEPKLQFLNLLVIFQLAVGNWKSLYVRHPSFVSPESVLHDRMNSLAEDAIVTLPYFEME